MCGRLTFIPDARLRLSDNLTGHFEEGVDRRGHHPRSPRQRQLQFGRHGIQATVHDTLLLTLLNR
jgi:hypothetical protein